MKITLQKEIYNVGNYPQDGRHIMAQTTNDLIVVYQAYRDSTADYTIENQKLGGPDYSFNRMSWIKPNFLWMMYRSGWAQKTGQERILAFWIPQNFFERILNEAVVSSFSASAYENEEEWKTDLHSKEVRLQWDPDHDPFGTPVKRRAIQLGLKGRTLREFATEAIQYVEDVTPFVAEQFVHVQNQQLGKLMVPVERVYIPTSISVATKVGLINTL